MPALTLENTNMDVEQRIGRPATRKEPLDATSQTQQVLTVTPAGEDGTAGVLRNEKPNVGSFAALKNHRQLMRDGAPAAIPIANSPSRSRSRAPESDTDDLLGPTKGVSEQLSARARRRKKRGMKKADPAITTVRGFDTPTPSGDEDSDFSASYFKKRDLSANTSRTSSPMIRAESGSNLPNSGGITSLRQQLSRLDMEPTPGNPALIRMKRTESSQGPVTPSVRSSGSGSDVEAPETTSYEIPLNDFVSNDVSVEPEVPSIDARLAMVNRKMTAEDFQPIMCLGKGAFGIVHMVKHKATGKLYAQKMFRKAFLTVRKTLVEQTKTERAVLESINRHPFVVKLYYAFQDREKLYLILEYAQGGELFTYLANERMFPEPTAAFYMAELVLALEHLHHNLGVVYRDLKPENCLLDSEGHLLLTDFGLSKVPVDGNDRCTSILGTIEYMAPEVILGHVYDRAVDWWSFGIMGYDFLTGSPPWVGNSHAKIQEKVLKAKLTFPYFVGLDAKDLLTRLLRKEPNKRLGANMPKDMQTIKKHRFFRQIDWKKLERREVEPPIKPLITDPELAENFSAEFTNMAMSPRKSEMMEGEPMSAVEGGDPFGGFSFVASPTLLRGFL
jgi:serine/threonine-protein kinase Psk1